MAKSKGGPTFFEVLRTTNNSPKPAAGRALENSRPEEPVVKSAPVVQEPLDLVKELAPKPVVRPVEPEAARPPATAMMPIIRHVDEGFEPDESGFRVTYTVGAFALLIAIVGMLGAFWFGVRQGRSTTPSVPAPSAAQKPQADSTPTPPQAVQQWFTIKLYSWGFANEVEKSTVRKIADQHREALSRKGYQAMIASTHKEIVLVYGKFKNRTESKNVLDALRRLDYNGRLYYEKADFVPAE